MCSGSIYVTGPTHERESALHAARCQSGVPKRNAVARRQTRFRVRDEQRVAPAHDDLIREQRAGHRYIVENIDLPARLEAGLEPSQDQAVRPDNGSSGSN